MRVPGAMQSTLLLCTIKDDGFFVTGVTLMKKCLWPCTLNLKMCLMGSPHLLGLQSTSRILLSWTVAWIGSGVLCAQKGSSGLGKV